MKLYDAQSKYFCIQSHKNTSASTTILLHHKKSFLRGNKCHRFFYKKGNISYSFHHNPFVRVNSK